MHLMTPSHPAPLRTDKPRPDHAEEFSPVYFKVCSVGRDVILRPCLDHSSRDQRIKHKLERLRSFTVHTHKGNRTIEIVPDARGGLLVTRGAAGLREFSEVQLSVSGAYVLTFTVVAANAPYWSLIGQTYLAVSAEAAHFNIHAARRVAQQLPVPHGTAAPSPERQDTLMVTAENGTLELRITKAEFHVIAPEYSSRRGVIQDGQICAVETLLPKQLLALRPHHATRNPEEKPCPTLSVDTQ